MRGTEDLGAVINELYRLDGMDKLDPTDLQRSLYNAGLVIVPLKPSLAMLAAGMSEQRLGLSQAYCAMVDEASAALGYAIRL